MVLIRFMDKHTEKTAMTTLKKIDRWIDVALVIEILVVVGLYLKQILA